MADASLRRPAKRKRKAVRVLTFPERCFAMLSSLENASVVAWTAAGTSFAVHKLSEFCADILPRYFSHGTYASFVRQLNFYNFQKVGPTEYMHESFRRGHPELLAAVRRQKVGHDRKHHVVAERAVAAQSEPHRALELKPAPADGTARDMSSVVTLRELAQVKEEIYRMARAQEAETAALRAENARLWARLQQADSDQQRRLESSAEFLLSFLAKALCKPSTTSALVAGNELLERLTLPDAAGADTQLARTAARTLTEVAADEWLERDDDLIANRDNTAFSFADWPTSKSLADSHYEGDVADVMMGDVFDSLLQQDGPLHSFVQPSPASAFAVEQTPLLASPAAATTPAFYAPTAATTPAFYAPTAAEGAVLVDSRVESPPAKRARLLDGESGTSAASAASAGDPEWAQWHDGSVSAITHSLLSKVHRAIAHLPPDASDTAGSGSCNLLAALAGSEIEPPLVDCAKKERPIAVLKAILSWIAARMPKHAS